MSVARFWALHQKQDLSSKLHLIFPFDLKDLIGSTVVNFMGATIDSTRTHGIATRSSGSENTSSENNDSGCSSSLQIVAVS
jgi:hypothetical protein